MNNFLLAVAGLIIAVFAAAFAVPYFVSWDDYRPEIEQQLSSLIGRKVKVDGSINIRLLPQPYMKLDKVRVLDTFPGAKKPFVEIEKFTLWLSAPSLLSGQISAKKLNMLNPVVNLVVDGQGRGNWEEFNQKDKTDSSVKMKDIALQEATIENGRIIFHSLVNKGNEIFKTPLLSGTLSAHSLSGPYKFKGNLENKAGAQTVMNFSTGRSDDPAGMPLTAFLQNKVQNYSYQLTSRIKAVSGGKLSYEGKMIAKVPFETLFARSKSAGAKALSKGAKKSPLEITANLTGTATRAKLKDIKFSLIRKNRPQALEGAVQLDWSQGDLQAVGQFNARLLDFDLMGGDVSKDFTMSALLAELPEHVYNFGNAFHRADFMLQLDQIHVGGEVVRKLEGTISKTLHDLTISNLTAKLPAASYLSLSGKIEKDSAHSVTFSGPLLIQGQNIGRFQSWMVSSKDKDALNKPFIFASEVIAGKGQVRLIDIDADIAGNVMVGEMRQNSETDKALNVKLDFINLNVEELFGEKISLKDLVQKQGNGEDALFRLPLLENVSLADFKKKKAKVSIRVGQLKLTDTILNDFFIDLDFGLKTKHLQEFSFITKEGLKVVLDGALPSAQMAVGQKLNLRVETLQSTALFQLMQLLSLDDGFDAEDGRLALIHPVGLNIGLERQAGVKGYHILLNGQAKDSEIFAYGYVGMTQKEKGKKRALSESNLDLKVSISNPDGKSLLRQFVTDLAGENLAGIAKGKGSLNLQLVGVPKQGMQTEIFGALPGLKLTAVGKIKIEDGAKNFVGPISLEAANMSQGLALLGLGIQAKPDAGGLTIKGNLTKVGGLYDLANLTGKIGGSDIYGVAQLDKRTKNPVFNVSLTSQDASLVSILEPGIDWFKQEKNKVKAEADKTIWTNKRFDLALLQGFSGKLALKTKALEIDQGLILKDAVLSANYGDGALTIDELSGKIFGGLMQSAFKIKHGRAVSAVTGTVEIKNADLKQLFSEQSDVLATGKANLSLNYSGSGLSPKGMVNLLKGKGTLELIDTQFNHLSPIAMQEIASEDNVVKNQEGKTFEERFAGYLSAGQFDAKTQKIALKISDGIISFKANNMKDQGVKLSVKTYISLASLEVDSEWRLKAGKEIKPKNMPEAVLQFAGKLSKLGEIKPAYKLKSLQSFLSVLKIEKDVDRLEELNSKLEKAAAEEKIAREAAGKSTEELKIPDAEGSKVEISPLGNLPDLTQPMSGVEISPLNDL